MLALEHQLAPAVVHTRLPHVRTDPADPLAHRGRGVAPGRGVGHHQSVTHKQLIGVGYFPSHLTGVLWRIARAN
jgi:hypothetical protein